MATTDKENGPLAGQKPPQASPFHQLLDARLLSVAFVALGLWCLTGIAHSFVRHRCISDAVTFSGRCHDRRLSEVPMERQNPLFSR